MNASFGRPKTEILVDGGDPLETVRVRNLVGVVDGQTEAFDIRHELTTKGIQQFVAGYKSTLKQSA